MEFSQKRVECQKIELPFTMGFSEIVLFIDMPARIDFHPPCLVDPCTIFLFFFLFLGWVSTPGKRVVFGLIRVGSILGQLMFGPIRLSCRNRSFCLGSVRVNSGFGYVVSSVGTDMCIGHSGLGLILPCLWVRCLGFFILQIEGKVGRLMNVGLFNYF